MTEHNQGYHSSNDYQPTGVTVLSNGGSSFNREVQSSADLNDNDLIAVEGMQMTAKQAKDMGLMSKVFNEDDTGPAENPESTPETAPKSDTGNAEYDTAIDNLNTYIDDGSITPAEGQAYDLGLAEIAMAGLSVENVTETLEGLSNGTIAEADVPADVRAMATQVERNVEQAATKAALTELGKPAFDALSQLASSHAGVNAVIRQYTADRAQGKHDGITWSELNQDIQEQLGNA